MMVENPDPATTSAADPVGRALRVLEITRARSGVQVGQTDLDAAARRFDLSAKQIAALERSAEERKLIALRASPEEVSRKAEASNDFDILAAFRKDVGSIRLMTHAEEIEHGDAVTFGAAAELALSTEELDDDERSRLTDSVQRGKRAFEEFIRRNIPLVMKMASSSQGRGLELNDLIQSGVIGLMRAVERWNPHRGYRFSTYATFWIRQCIDRELAYTGRAIRLPVHVIEWQARIVKAERELSRRYNRSVAEREISDAIGLAPEKVALYKDLAAGHVSLDQPVGEENDSTLGDFQATSDLGPLAAAIANERTDAIIALLKRLPQRDRMILIMRCGLDDTGPKTLEEVGARFGVTRERIRQLEAKALLKIRSIIATTHANEVLKP